MAPATLASFRVTEPLVTAQIVFWRSVTDDG